MDFAATAIIDTAALKHNFEVLRRASPGCKVMAVIKANAYGHGLVPVATALENADSFAVARISEARALREAGVRTPIVLLEGVFDASDLQAALALDCETVVHCDEQLALLAASDRQPGIIWIKVDSGMNRLGFPPDRFAGVVAQVSATCEYAELRLLSHFASADLDSSYQTTAQLHTLKPLIESWGGGLSLANSPGGLRGLAAGGFSATDRDVWIRPGIGLYGITPFEDGGAPEHEPLVPVMEFSAKIIATRTIGIGDRVGYGGRFRADKPMRVGIVAAGYGDGYPRMLPDGAPVLIDGARAGLVGRVSMDMLAVDLTDLPDSGYGSAVTLWGKALPVGVVANALGTIGYELVTRVSDRVTRRYL
ncbi:MAG: alanine racemase [Pseudomonadota bacterium]